MPAEGSVNPDMERGYARPAPIQFRSKELEDELQARSDPGASLGQSAQRDLERYYSLLRYSLPQFSAGEASLIADALNGTLTTPETVRLLWAEIDDAIRLDALDKKWGVDGPALVQRLRSLLPFECLAVIDAVERFWIGPYRKEEPIEEQLRAVGLVREERNGC